jgi:bidirectional [NiFe] hydrogenase diaphorase subunit
MARVVTFKIDDQDVSGRDDETVLNIAREHGIFIPTLCHLEGISDIGACRLCVVEIKGARRPAPSCVTLPQEGMEVFTKTEKLANHRQMIIEMLFSEGNHICSVCVLNGHCDLQNMAVKLGVTHITIPYRYPIRSVDGSHERFGLDRNRCILCTRCVRVCEEIEGAQTWGLQGRGIKAQVITDMTQPWGTSETCTSCGKCVQVCPTGALFEKGKSVAEMAKHREFLPYLATMRKK